MPPFYGHSITRVFLEVDFMARLEASSPRNELLISIGLLMMKHSYSMAIRGPVDDLDYLKELIIIACYLYGSGIFRKMIIRPELHLGHWRLSFPVMVR